MTYLNIKPNHDVTVTIRGRVRDIDADHIYLDGIGKGIPINKYGDMVTVTLDDPQGWPVQAGDIWALDTGREVEHWHAIACRDYAGEVGAVELQLTRPTVPDLDWHQPEDLLDRGGLRLVWRDGKAVA